jgi:hypothetical protein
VLITVHRKKKNPKIPLLIFLRDSNEERGSLLSSLTAYNIPVFRIHIGLNADLDTGINRSAGPGPDQAKPYIYFLVR